MIKAIVTDFSRVLLTPKDENYKGGLNDLQRELTAQGEYDFWDYFVLNQELLEFYRKLRQSTEVYLFTSEYIQEHPAVAQTLTDSFKHVFSAARLDVKKSNRETYKMVAQMIQLEPEEILYIDDKQSNLDMAREAGCATIHFESNEQVMRDIHAYFSS